MIESAWLCQCGHGDLFDGPPETCPLCGFALWVHFGITEDASPQNEGTYTAYIYIAQEVEA